MKIANKEQQRKQEKLNKTGIYKAVTRKRYTVLEERNDLVKMTLKKTWNGIEFHDQ